MNAWKSYLLLAISKCRLNVLKVKLIYLKRMTIGANSGFGAVQQTRGNKMKEKIIKFVVQVIAYVVFVVLAGAIVRNMHDLFMFGYNLGY